MERDEAGKEEKSEETEVRRASGERERKKKKQGNT